MRMDGLREPRGEGKERVELCEERTNERALRALLDKGKQRATRESERLRGMSETRDRAA